MKKISTLLSVFVFAFAFVSCNGGQPEGGDGTTKLLPPYIVVEEQTGNSFTITWDFTDNAVSYSYVFQDEEIKNTTQNVLKFENLESGSYTVKVRSNAARHSKWSNSDFREVTVELDGDVYNISITDVEWNAATISCFPNNDKSYLFDILLKEFYDTFKSDEEMVADYMNYALSQGLALRYVLKIGNSSFDLKGLYPDTEYVVFAVGTDSDGNFTSKVFTETFSTAKMPDVEPEMAKWFGTWTATSEKTLVWTVEMGKSPVSEVVDKPKSFDIKIYGDPINFTQALIDGWATCKTDLPVVAATDEDGNLMLISDVSMGSPDERGLSPKWGSYSKISQDGKADRFSLVYSQFPAYTFVMNGNKAESEPFSDARSDGSQFTVVAFDIFAVADGGYTIYLDKDGKCPDMASGKVTLTKKTSSAKYVLLQEMNHNK